MITFTPQKENLNTLQEIKNLLGIEDNKELLQKIKDIIKPKEMVFGSACIDWEKINAFSMRESAHDNKIEYTIIGYYKFENNNTTIGEWKLYITLEEHNRLIKEFTDFKNSKK